MRIGVIGCAGRMGRANMAEILKSDDLELVGGVELAGSPALGEDLGVLAGRDPVGIVATHDLPSMLTAAHAVIEFSSPQASLANAELCAEAGCAHVIGTTGLDDAQKARLAELGKRIPIVWAANMSQGVNLLLGLVEQVARSLAVDFDIEIVEAHHRHKVDAPSGTALALGEAAAAGRGVRLDDVADRGRDGMTGPRRSGDIGFAVMRGGDVIGDHTVLFAGEGERIELTHKASSREIYSRGRCGQHAGRRPALPVSTA
ncbi:MAG: 4-hydroxy-tetrahydrodipicolinate reductase [Geminicoccaceae bacterium]